MAPLEHCFDTRSDYHDQKSHIEKMDKELERLNNVQHNLHVLAINPKQAVFSIDSLAAELLLVCFNLSQQWDEIKNDKR